MTTGSPPLHESREGRTLAGLVAAVVAVDLALFVAPPGGSLAGPVRVVLAAVATVGVPAVLVAGAVRGRVHPLAAVVGAPLAGVYAYTGLLLPWTQFSFWLGQATLDAALAVPVAGEPLAEMLFGGSTLSQATLRRAFRVHAAAVGVGVLCLLYLAGNAARSHTSMHMEKH